MIDELEALKTELQQVRGTLPSRIDVDPEGLEHGLAQLVLTLVEFLRQLLERQAVRRMEGGSLSDEEVERVGLALMKLEEKVHQLGSQLVALRPLTGHPGQYGDHDRPPREQDRGARAPVGTLPELSNFVGSSPSIPTPQEVN